MRHETPHDDYGRRPGYVVQHEHHRGGAHPLGQQQGEGRDLVNSRYFSETRDRLYGRFAPVFRRFPDTRTHHYGGDLSNLEIPGSHGSRFVHVRYGVASNAGGRQPCRCGGYDYNVDSLIVAVDGACPGNGNQGVWGSACGVYFGRHNPHNLSFRVSDDDGSGHTNQRAELRAAIAGLGAVRLFCERGGQSHCPRAREEDGGPCKVRHVVVKSDSAYLVDSLGGCKDRRPPHVWKWLGNGFTNCKGEPVKNFDLWDKLLREMVALKTLGAEVEFWHVPRAENKEADQLANQALG